MTRYYVVCAADGEAERLDWTYSAKEAEKWIGEYQKEDEAERAKGVAVPRYEYSVVEEDEEDGEEDGEERELECGDYPDSRSVVVAGGRVKRFASGYAREMWEIGMREGDFC